MKQYVSRSKVSAWRFRYVDKIVGANEWHRSIFFLVKENFLLVLLRRFESEIGKAGLRERESEGREEDCGDFNDR